MEQLGQTDLPSQEKKIGASHNTPASAAAPPKHCGAEPIAAIVPRPHPLAADSRVVEPVLNKVAPFVFVRVDPSIERRRRLIHHFLAP
jgi:hypothetical protein